MQNLNCEQNLFILKIHIAQSARTVEYIDCTYAEGKDPLQTSVLEMKQNNLIVRF